LIPVALAGLVQEEWALGFTLNRSDWLSMIARALQDDGVAGVVPGQQSYRV
jgi:hypothetical protein